MTMGGFAEEVGGWVLEVGPDLRLGSWELGVGWELEGGGWNSRPVTGEYGTSGPWLGMVFARYVMPGTASMPAAFAARSAAAARGGSSSPADASRATSCCDSMRRSDSP